MFKKIALLTICLLSAICITACGSGGTENNYDFTVNDITIEVGEQVLVMPQFSDGQSHDYSVTVMSGGTCISASGKSITGKKEGQAEIRVTSGSESKTLRSLCR